MSKILAVASSETVNALFLFLENIYIVKYCKCFMIDMHIKLKRL